MRAEIIAVGTELLLGEVINSNAAWLSARLAALGVEVYHHHTVGDNPARIQALVDHVLRRPENRPALLLFSGGLGPTPDDLTVQTLAEHFQTPMVSDPVSEAAIQAFFERRGQSAKASNLKQALRPQTAAVLPNPLGTAPGILWDLTGPLGQPTGLITFPGVPRELEAMWPAAEAWIRNFQRQQGETPMALVTRQLRFVGAGESVLADRLTDLMALSNPSVAPYVGRWEVRIRLAAKAETEAAARALIAPVQADVIARCADYYLGEDDTTLEGRIAERLLARGWRLAVAESCTGGLLSARLTDVPGSSAWTTLNVVTYANAEKTRLLGVPADLLATHGAVSEPVAAAMAQGIRQQTGAEVGLAITGIAGPTGGTAEKPVGLVFIAIAAPSAEPVVHRVQLAPNLQRPEMKYGFSQYALHHLLRQLSDSSPTEPLG